MARERNETYRKELAKQAFETLSRLGSVGVSMTELARELGITRSLLYFYFPNQRAIGEAVLETMLERNRDISATIDLDQLDSRQALLAYVVAIFKMGTRTNAEWETLARVLTLYTDSPVTMLQQMQTNMQPFRQRLADKLHLAMSEREIALCDPEGFVAATRAFAEGSLVQCVAGGMTQAMALHQYSEIFLKALAPAQEGGRRQPDTDSKPDAHSKPDAYSKKDTPKKKSGKKKSGEKRGKRKKEKTTEK